MVPSMAAFFFLLFTLLPSFISPSPITLPLQQHLLPPTSFSSPYQNLNSLVNSSLTRAHQIKHPANRQSATSTSSASDFTAKTELSPHSYGGYSTSLSFGTPPQTLSFVVDTASSFVWFPCTTHYFCEHCVFPSPTSKIPSFIPVLSSSSKIVGCRNPKCSWIHGRRRRSEQCGNCGYNGGGRRSRYCSQICPPYLILYGSGTTGGVALSETLRFRNLTIPNFLIGCSVFSSRQPAGIAGLGRGRSSLASQLGLARFSYCLLSHQFDDDSVRSGYLVLDSGSDSGTKTRGMIYTPFVKNPFVLNKPDYSVYYYLGLRRISVGGRRVEIPYRHLSPGIDGSGGTIVDSGTTFTFMSRGVFEPVSRELVAQMERSNGNYSRSRAAEAATGLRPCFRVHGKGAAAFPELKLHFKGGADMVLPVENYFTYVGSGEVACLAVVTDGMEEGSGGGPSVILGNFQMQNFRVEYDLANQRFGFKQQPCSHH
ncbi:unnamed protein product [Linum tenue]|uniref:Peptidase A1 domain-containing protein n=2 Tax=Linum tenue TaxID=586396 RepID=A0AAV0QGK5_9ROSI|nr:unnamed protein product [Linum tenue]